MPRPVDYTGWHTGGVSMAEVEIGKVSDFFARPVVAGIELTGSLKVGDRIRIKGHTTDMELTVTSMQINKCKDFHERIPKNKKFKIYVS